MFSGRRLATAHSHKRCQKNKSEVIKAGASELRRVIVRVAQRTSTMGRGQGGVTRARTYVPSGALDKQKATSCRCSWDPTHAAKGSASSQRNRRASAATATGHVASEVCSNSMGSCGHHNGARLQEAHPVFSPRNVVSSSQRMGCAAVHTDACNASGRGAPAAGWDAFAEAPPVQASTGGLARSV